jgi:hypothetical protein
VPWTILAESRRVVYVAVPFPQEILRVEFRIFTHETISGRYGHGNKTDCHEAQNTENHFSFLCQLTQSLKPIR